MFIFSECARFCKSNFGLRGSSHRLKGANYYPTVAYKGRHNVDPIQILNTSAVLAGPLIGPCQSRPEWARNKPNNQ